MAVSGSVGAAPTGDAPADGAQRNLVEDLLGEPLGTLRHDPRRLIAIAATVSGWVILLLWLARVPRLSLEPGILAPAVGGALGMLLGGMARERARRSTRPFFLAALRAGAFLLVACMTVAGAILLNPALQSDDLAVSLPVAVFAVVLLAAGALLWERNPAERAIVAMAFATVAYLLAGIAGLLLGEGWTWLAAAGFAGTVILAAATLALRVQVGWGP
jgi:hypothetical protein